MSQAILLIEDDPRLAGMVAEYLGKAGFHVTHAGTGAQGLALQTRDPVDAVILDLMLPTSTASRSAGKSAPAPTRRF